MSPWTLSLLPKPWAMAFSGRLVPALPPTEGFPWTASDSGCLNLLTFPFSAKGDPWLHAGLEHFSTSALTWAAPSPTQRKGWGSVGGGWGGGHRWGRVVGHSSPWLKWGYRQKEEGPCVQTGTEWDSRFTRSCRPHLPHAYLGARGWRCSGPCPWGAHSLGWDSMSVYIFNRPGIEHKLILFLRKRFVVHPKFLKHMILQWRYDVPEITFVWISDTDEITALHRDQAEAGDGPPGLQAQRAAPTLSPCFSFLIQAPPKRRSLEARLLSGEWKQRIRMETPMKTKPLKKSGLQVHTGSTGLHRHCPRGCLARVWVVSSSMCILSFISPLS